MVRSRAVAWGCRPDRIGVLGFSAGGHLAASASTRYSEHLHDPVDEIDAVDARPDAAALCYPVIRLLAPDGHVGSGSNLLGPDAEESVREAHGADAHVTPDTPPTFLWHTAEDEGVPVENSLHHARALSAHGVSFALHVFPEGRHGIGLAEEEGGAARAWPDLLTTWLTDAGF